MSRLVGPRSNGSAALDDYGISMVALARLLTGDVIEGLAVVPTTTPSMNVVVSQGSASIVTGAYPSSFRQTAWIDTTAGTPAGENVLITTAPGANSRIDAIVMYIDYSLATSSATANNPGVMKVAAVAGTVSGSPVAPNTSAIQTAIGASNPFIRLANVTVGTSVTSITSGNIADVRSFAFINSVNLGSTWTDYSASSTVVGWSSITEKIVRYTQVGKTVYVNYSLGGTSNATTATFTVPVVAKSINSGAGNLCIDGCTGLNFDNGVQQSTPARVYIDPSVNTSLVNIVKAMGTTNWTASGSKVIRGLLIYEAA